MADPLCALGIEEAASLKVVEHSPDAMILINKSGQIILFNSKAELMFGYERNEILGREVEVLLPEGLRQVHQGHRTKFFHDPRTREMGQSGMRLEGINRDRETFRVEIKLAPFPVANAGVHVLAVVRRIQDEPKGTPTTAEITS